MQRPFRQLDAFDQRLEAGIGGFAGVHRHGVQRALQIVGDVEHVARERGNAIGPRVGDFTLGPLAQIFHLRERAQHAIFGLGHVLGERFDRTFLGIIGHHVRL